MITIFASLFAVGFVVLSVSMLFGHDDLTVDDLDLDGGDDPKIGGVKVVASFLTAFGAIGVLARWSGASTMASSVAGVSGGIILAVMMYGLLRVVYRQQSSSHVDALRLPGCTGLVSIEIPPTGLGEIILEVPGGQQTFVARSVGQRLLPVGESIEVVRVVGEQAVVKTKGA